MHRRDAHLSNIPHKVNCIVITYSRLLEDIDTTLVTILITILVTILGGDSSGDSSDNKLLMQISFPSKKQLQYF